MSVWEQRVPLVLERLVVTRHAVAVMMSDRERKRDPSFGFLLDHSCFCNNQSPICLWEQHWHDRSKQQATATIWPCSFRTCQVGLILCPSPPCRSPLLCQSTHVRWPLLIIKTVSVPVCVLYGSAFFFLNDTCRPTPTGQL